MNDDLLTHLGGAIRRFLTLAREDAELRMHLRALGGALLNLTDAGPASTAPAEPREAGEPPAPANLPDESQSARVITPPTIRGPQVVRPSFDFRNIRIGAAAPRVPLEGEVWSTARGAVEPTIEIVPDEELGRILSRCAVKRDAANWSARVIEAGGGELPEAGELAQQRGALIERARALPDCYLWMCHTATYAGGTPAAWRRLAASFDALSRAADLMIQSLRQGDVRDDFVREAATLFGEAQSMLRAAAAPLEEQTDLDQERAFAWLRRFTREQDVYVARHMRLSDPADPEMAEDLAARIGETTGRLENVHRAAHQRVKLISKVRDKADVISRNGERDHAWDWQKLIEATDELVRIGLPPSSVDIRTHWLKVHELMPDLGDLPDNVERVLRELDRFLVTREQSAGPREGEAAAPAPSASVQRVGQILRGRSVVFVGGDERPHARRALIEAFGLEDLIWVRTSESNTHIDYEHEIARPDVALVLLAIRWIRHALNDTREIARRYGKPLVNLPGGYNANQVAEQILKQCGEQLRAAV